jgi:hypothetical protein
MRIEKIMKRYYVDKLREISDAPRPETRPVMSDTRKSRPFSVSWEDALGFAVTASYLMQFLMPERWFVLGRFLSVFRIGF